MRKPRIFNAYALLATISLIPAASMAEMYKWVDAEGNTHYTQSPPPGDIEAKTIKPPPAVNSDEARKKLEARKQLLKGSRDQRISAAEKKARSQADAKAAESLCQQAKKKLASYQRPRVNKVDEQGNRIRIGEEERQAKIQEAQKQVSDNCK